MAEDLAAALQGGCGAYFREDDKLYYQASGLLQRAEAAAATGGVSARRGCGVACVRQGGVCCRLPLGGSSTRGGHALPSHTHTPNRPPTHPPSPPLPASLPPLAADREALTREAVSLMLRVPLACDLAHVVPQLAYLRALQAIVDLPLRVSGLHAGSLCSWGWAGCSGCCLFQQASFCGCLV